MSVSVNKVILVGYLGKDPEIRSTSNGGHIANLSVGTTTSYKGKDGKWVNNTEWNRVVTFNDFLVEQAQKMHKGDTVYVEGTLKSRKWTDQKGEDKYVTEIVLEPFKGVLQQISEGTMADKGFAARGTTNRKPATEDLDDEIPF